MADPEGRAAAALPRSVRGADGAAITSLVLVLLDETLRRLTTIATSPGLPYRDFAVEYGPLDTLMISLLASSGYPALWDRIHVVAMCADIATWFVIARRWGSRAGATYLLLGLPLVWLCYARLDLMSVMLATLGVAWVDQAHDRRGGLTVAAAALSKLWPVVILPIMWETGSRRAVLWTISAVSIGALVWMATTTPSAPLQVVTYRGATGWSVESTVGTIVWTTTDSDLRMEEGSQRVGLMAPWERTILAAILGVTLIGIALKVRHKTSGFIGGASLAAVAALLTCSPLSSLQYA
jgi:hypothetical protein